MYKQRGWAIDSAEINVTGRSILQDTAARPTGGTHLYDAVYLASNELMKARFGRKVLVLVTDGEDQGNKTSLQKSIEAAEKADVIVYSIVVSDPEFYSLLGTYHGGSSVRKLARETGGCTIRVKSIEQIGQAFEQIARGASLAISPGLFSVKFSPRRFLSTDPRKSPQSQLHSPDSHRVL